MTREESGTFCMRLDNQLKKLLKQLKVEFLYSLVPTLNRKNTLTIGKEGIY